MDSFYFLLAGLGSLLAALLYGINGLITVSLLRQNITKIAAEKKASKQISIINVNPNVRLFSSILFKKIE